MPVALPLAFTGTQSPGPAEAPFDVRPLPIPSARSARPASSHHSNWTTLLQNGPT